MQALRSQEWLSNIIIRHIFAVQTRIVAIGCNISGLHQLSDRESFAFSCVLWCSTLPFSVYVDNNWQQVPRKRRIQNMHLVTFEGECNYICKAAETSKEASEPIEAGFEYVCELENTKLFRKRR